VHILKLYGAKFSFYAVLCKTNRVQKGEAFNFNLILI